MNKNNNFKLSNHTTLKDLICSFFMLLAFLKLSTMCDMAIAKTNSVNPQQFQVIISDPQVPYDCDKDNVKQNELNVKVESKEYLLGNKAHLKCGKNQSYINIPFAITATYLFQDEDKCLKVIERLCTKSQTKKIVLNLETNAHIENTLKNIVRSFYTEK